MTRSLIATIVLLSIAAPAAAQPKWVSERLALERACGAGDFGACTDAGGAIEIGRGGPSRSFEPNPEAAVPFYERACVNGHMPGCERLARLYEGGRGLSKNLRRASMLYASACDAGDADGCLGAARVAEQGAPAEGLDPEPGRAVAMRARGSQLLTSSCDRGDGQACVRLAFDFNDGRSGLTKDPARALALFSRACDLDDVTGCAQAARIYSDTTAKASLDQARGDALFARSRALQMQRCDAGDLYACASFVDNEGAYKGCGHGDPDACFQLAMHYIGGLEEQPTDAEKAAHFLVRGCEQGEPTLCTEAGDLFVGVYYRAGRQVAPPDYARAVALYTRGCDLGDNEACQKFAALATEGRGTGKDPARAAALRQQGCDNGDAFACMSLAELHQRGDGVPRDLSRAAQLFDRSCKLAHGPGCVELGLRYRDGQGVARDPVVARKLLHDVCATNPYYGPSALTGCHEACALNDGAACAALARAAEQGSPHPSLQPRDVTPLYERAARTLAAECEAGVAQSCFDYGRLYRNERPLRRDWTLHRQSIERACTLGLGPACHAVAQGYDGGGESFDRNHPRALEVYLRACELEHVDSCERAGRMILDGDGQPADARRGQSLLDRAQALKRKRGF